MAKLTIDEQIEQGLLLTNESKAPEMVRRFITKYRETYGPKAKRNIRRSNEWFMQRISKDNRISKDKAFKQFGESFKSRTPKDRGLIGRMFLYKYDPKHKETLPVWDGNPLVFFFNTFIGDGNYGEKGVQYLLGINVHYLRPRDRLFLFSNIVKFNNDTALREKSRLKLTWNVLKSFAAAQEAQHAVKMYRADHIRTQLIEINPRYWEVVMFLQIQNFVKGSNKLAWKRK